MILVVSVLLRFVACLLFSPFLLGVIGKTKAFFAGKKGPPLLQPYYDIVKLLQKSGVYSLTTTWIFRAAPLISMSAVLIASFLIPFGDFKAPVQFWGDVILFAYLFGLARFFTVLAALDTGSSFEGMGANREIVFSCLSEVVLFLNFTVLVVLSKSFSLSQMIGDRSWASWTAVGPSLILVIVSYFMILLVENSRIPIDDPATHLELTMIHEVMVLDHGGPDYAFILHASAIKLFVLGSFFVTLLIPFQSHSLVINAAIFFAGMTGLAVVIGIVESVRARLRMNRIPSFITGAFVLALFGLIIALARAS
ncbi:MAG: NADH-quinone oxidoreductase subunit H [Candidatus Omnitrophica bacterium]|nr:NADH-quinone oxidoreductase subunit H [Candidatus Omnitrophota bacterium]